jgi:RNA polymerase-binding protein DksA
MLPNDFIEKQKKALEKEQEKLESDIERLRKYPDYGDMSDDNESELQDYETNMSLDDQMETILKKVKVALMAINNSTYGQCAKCKQQIEKGRLKIMPYANLCITCQTKK